MWSDRDVSHDLVAHSEEQRPLEWLSVKVCNHLVRGAVVLYCTYSTSVPYSLTPIGS